MLLCVGQLGHTGVSLADERVERRLTAILAADVAGYSRLMGADEEGTLAQLKAIRKTLVDPTIAAHRGRIVKTTGDGMLVEFASAVDAARGASEVQRGMAKQNANVPQDARIEFRIGIHVGDIIIDDNDIFGDGVNIAARLEGIAEPGGICISDDAQRKIRGKIDIAFDDIRTAFVDYPTRNDGSQWDQTYKELAECQMLANAVLIALNKKGFAITKVV